MAVVYTVDPMCKIQLMRIRSLTPALVLIMVIVSAIAIACSSMPTPTSMPAPTPTPMFYPGELTQLIRRDLAEIPFSFKSTIDQIKPSMRSRADQMMTCDVVLDVLLQNPEWKEQKVNVRVWSVSAAHGSLPSVSITWHVNGHTLTVTLYDLLVEPAPDVKTTIAHCLNPRWLVRGLNTPMNHGNPAPTATATPLPNLGGLFGEFTTRSI